VFLQGFAYSDYRVSEIITGYGRLIHKRMEKMGFEHCFQTVFGFTDSIFIRHHGTGSAVNITTTDSLERYISHFLGDCQHQLNINLNIRIDFYLQSSLTRRIAILLGLITLWIAQS
jgi:hypothetical protein